VYPNPAINGEEITFEYVLPKNKPGQLEIFDVNGRKIYSAKLSPWSMVHKIKLPLNAGLYFAKMTSGNVSGGKRFVVSE
jgi:hypothetical protein